jgi:PKD repeat protein
MEKVLVLLSIAAMLIITSCNKTPEANFTANKLAAEIDEEIAFTNISSDGVTYKWDFGDGSSSTDESPTHKFNVAGTYSVILTAYSKKEKKSHESSQTLIILAEPYRFTGNLDGATINFSTSKPENRLQFENTTSYYNSKYNKILGCYIYKTNTEDIREIHIRIGTMSYTGGQEAPISAITNFLTSTSYQYSNNAQMGVEIFIKDVFGNIWSSDGGSQSGSTFVISDVSTVVDENGDELVSFKANFNVKLYNSSSSSIRNFTNGYFYGAFSDY